MIEGENKGTADRRNVGRLKVGREMKMRVSTSTSGEEEWGGGLNDQGLNKHEWTKGKQEHI